MRDFVGHGLRIGTVTLAIFLGAWILFGSPRRRVLAVQARRALAREEVSRAIDLYRRRAGAPGRASWPARLDHARALVKAGRPLAVIDTLERLVQGPEPVVVAARTGLGALYLELTATSGSMEERARMARRAREEARKALLLRPGHRPAVRVLVAANGHLARSRKGLDGGPEDARPEGGEPGYRTRRVGSGMDSSRARALVRSVTAVGLGGLRDRVVDLLRKPGQGGTMDDEARRDGRGPPW